VLSDPSQYRIGNVGPGATVLQGENLSVIVSSISTAELKELTRAAAAGAVGPFADKIVDLSQKLGATLGSMRTMLATVDQSGVPDEKLAETLAKVFEQNRKAADAIAALRPDNPIARAHVAEAAEAQTRGDREEARRHLRAAREAAEAAAAEAQRLARQAETAAGQQMLQAAHATSAEAELALAGLDYEEAARLFGEAVALVPADALDEKGDLLLRQADALQRQGDERGDNAALRKALQVYDRALTTMARERVPLDWATTQNNLGTALSTLGQRETGTERLLEAVDAFRDALKEMTRERVPLQWAMTQNNLGNALSRLGQRETGTTRLGEALAAWEACLTLTVSVWPTEWINEVRSNCDEVRTEIARRSPALRP
jgi:tetratricopeptide (TPR) repeat protein